ncbi:hypothetical protein AB7942_04755 [Neobacillus sp. BF23-41]|uniref:hypothetical protein n=1 Tax=Neobacillus sp. BF23-41 TaxID=3240280 RepID=UPI0034E5D13A
MKSKEETLIDLKRELLRIGSTNQRDYNLLKRKGQVLSTTICRRLKLSWPEVVKKLDGKANTSQIISNELY